MSPTQGPSETLATLITTLRAKVDSEQLTPRRAAAMLGDRARHLLTLRPLDPALWTAFEVLRDANFVPPAPLTLPQGSPEAVWRQLIRRSDAECEALVATVVTLPDPATEADAALGVLALLIRLGGKHLARTEPLLAALHANRAADPTTLTRWAIRLGAARLRAKGDTTPAGWDTATRTPPGSPPSLTAWAAHVAAAGLLPVGDHGVVAVRGGERLVNLPLALRRTPALEEALAPTLRRFLAARKATPDNEDAATALLNAVDAADEAGDFATGSTLLLNAYTRAGEADDLGRAIAARATLLLDDALAGHVRGVDPKTLDALRSRGRVIPTPRFPAAPTPPHRGWTAQIATLLDRAPTDEDLALLEAAGAHEAAARGWLSRDGRDALFQAARLAEHLDAEARAGLQARLAEWGATDVATLAREPARQEAEAIRWALTDDPAERHIIALRLAEAAPSHDVEAPGAPDVEPDPHAFENRVSAAIDLLDEGRDDAAATVAAALVKKWADGKDHAQAETLLTRLLGADDVNSELLRSVERHLHEHDVAGAALLALLGRDALAAYPLHDTLQAIAVDIARSDAERVAALRAWLGIWSATKTPPAVDVVDKFLTEDAALLPLAAAQLKGVSDPITRTRVFRLIAPSDPAALADAVLALALEG